MVLIWSCLGWIVLLRFPLIFGVVLLLLPFICLVKAKSLLANLFDVDAIGMTFVTLTSLTAAWSVATTSWLVIMYGHLRVVGASDLAALNPDMTVWYAIFSFLAVPVLAGVFLYAPLQLSTTYVRLVSGTVAGATCAAGVLLIASRISRHAAVGQVADSLLWSIRTLGLGGQGYLDNNYQLLPGHLSAFILAALTFAVYIALGIVKWLRPGCPTYVPTLAYVLLMLMLYCWALSALAFAADGLGVPVTLIIGMFLFLSYWNPLTDHFYRTVEIQEAQDGTPLLAPDPLTVIRAGKTDSVVLVAASGGGIQAAAWTARVLTGIEKLAREQFGTQPGESSVFTKSLRVVSSVSAGSVGSMYFVNQFKKGALPDDSVLDQIVTDAETSSLEDVAWGLLYPDLWRAILPIFPMKLSGRGRALERAWTRSKQLQQDLGHRLSDWFSEVATGDRPANIFNATLTETGDRLLLGSTYLPPTAPKEQTARWDFHKLYEKDVAVVTSARLSATFPYVTPASRADIGGPWKGELHVVDGGYYDNYGVSTLVEWLDSALEADVADAKRQIKRVLVIQINGFPEPDNSNPPRSSSRRSWVFQFYAPLTTMFRVRNAGQRGHKQIELDLLQAKWARADQLQAQLIEKWRGQVDISSVAFNFDSESAIKRLASFGQVSPRSLSQKPAREAPQPPMSWHLTPLQKLAIEIDWKHKSIGNEWQIVRQFLTSVSGTDPAAVTPL
jgi:Patatin-like phospholipase